MGLIVENDKVTHEWLKKGWFEVTNKASKKKTFIFASKEYEAEDGRTVTVFFVPETVFVLFDPNDGDEGYLFTAKDMADTWKELGGIGNFPYALDECVHIIESGDEHCKESVLEQFGLTQYREDIEDRFNRDIVQYGVESEINFM